MTTRVDIDLPALRRHLEGPETQRALDDIINTIDDNAQELTPKRTGDMRLGFVTSRPSSLRRRLAHVSSFYHLVEYGSINNPAYAPIRRAVFQAGLWTYFKSAQKS